MKKIKLKGYEEFQQLKTDLLKLEKDGGNLPTYILYGAGEEYVFKFDKLGEVENFVLFLKNSIKKCKGFVTISIVCENELSVMDLQRIAIFGKGQKKIKGVKLRLVRFSKYDWYEVSLGA